MKLKNKKTGEISNDFKGIIFEEGKNKVYNSLAELNEEWEDYEEPKQQYYIKENGDIGTCGAIEDDIPDEMLSEMKSIGNYFETEEEAEKAVEKLKAWKRLKDAGFKFTGCYDDNTIEFVVNDLSSRTEEDLGLLFGSEE